MSQEQTPRMDIPPVEVPALSTNNASYTTSSLLAQPQMQMSAPTTTTTRQEINQTQSTTQEFYATSPTEYVPQEQHTILKRDVEETKRLRSVSEGPLSRGRLSQLAVPEEQRRSTSVSVRSSRVVSQHEVNPPGRYERERRSIGTSVIQEHMQGVHTVRESLIEMYGHSNVGTDDLGDYIIKRVTIPTVEQVTTERKVVERRENFIEKKVPQVVFNDRIVYVPVVEYRDVFHEVEDIVIKPVHVSKLRIEEIPIDKPVYVTVYQDVVKEERIEVPGPIIEVPKKYWVERPVVKAVYNNRRVPVVVAQSLWPVITTDVLDESLEDSYVDVDCRKISFKVVERDVFIPLVCNRSLIFERMEVRHREVLLHHIPDAQYNALIKTFNPSLQLPDAVDLFRFVSMDRIASTGVPYTHTDQGALAIINGPGTYDVPIKEDVRIVNTAIPQQHLKIYQHQKGPFAYSDTTATHHVTTNSQGHVYHSPVQMGGFQLGEVQSSVHATASHTAATHTTATHTTATHTTASHAIGAHAIGGQSIGAHAVGGQSIGAHAIGAHAIGAINIGTHSMGNHVIGSHPIGALNMEKVEQQVREPSWSSSQRKVSTPADYGARKLSLEQNSTGHFQSTTTLGNLQVTTDRQYPHSARDIQVNQMHQGAFDADEYDATNRRQTDDETIHSQECLQNLKWKYSHGEQNVSSSYDDDPTKTITDHLSKPSDGTLMTSSLLNCLAEIVHEQEETIPSWGDYKQY